MIDVDAICSNIVRRARAIQSLIQLGQGSLALVDMYYSSDEGLNENQAVAQYLWRKTLPEMQPEILDSDEDVGIFLIDGVLGGRPHSWIALRPVADIAYEVIVDPYFPHAMPQVLLIESKSPIFDQYVEKSRYGVGELE